MELNEQEIIQLEAFWRGELSNKEQKSLEKRLKDDIAFRAAATHWKQIVYQGFGPTKADLGEQEKLRFQLKELEASLPPFESGKSIDLRSRYIRMLVAATAAILVLIGGSLILLNNRSVSQTYFTHLDRDNANLAAGRTAGEIAYDEKNYREAWSLLEQEIEIPNDSLNLLYGGIAALGAGEGMEAIRMLSAILDSEEWAYYHEVAKWYLGLAYLEEEQQGKAQEVFGEIVVGESQYADNAKEILEELKE